MAICLDSPYVTMTFCRRHHDVLFRHTYVCASRLSTSCRRRFDVIPTSCMLPGLLVHYAQSSTWFVPLLSLTRLDDILVTYRYGLCARLYLYLLYLYIYWVGDGTIPIFNLLCNHPSVVTCEIPRTLARPL